MDIRIEKFELIRRLLEVADEKVLIKVKKLLQKEGITMKAELLSQEEEEAVLKSLEAAEEDIKYGRLHSQADVEKRFGMKAKDQRI